MRRIFWVLIFFSALFSIVILVTDFSWSEFYETKIQKTPYLHYQIGRDLKAIKNLELKKIRSIDVKNRIAGFSTENLQAYLVKKLNTKNDGSIEMEIEIFESDDPVDEKKPEEIILQISLFDKKTNNKILEFAKPYRK